MSFGARFLSLLVVVVFVGIPSEKAVSATNDGAQLAHAVRIFTRESLQPASDNPKRYDVTVDTSSTEPNCAVAKNKSINITFDELPAGKVSATMMHQSGSLNIADPYSDAEETIILVMGKAQPYTVMAVQWNNFRNDAVNDTVSQTKQLTLPGGKSFSDVSIVIYLLAC